MTLLHLCCPVSGWVSNPASVISSILWSKNIQGSQLGCSLCSKAKRQIGTIHRHFHLAGSNVLTHLFKSLVLPTLHYCSSLWDPHFAIHINKLESIQKFAARMFTRNWQGTYPDLLTRLHWPTLSIRRRQKAALCYRIISNHSFIPSSLFTPHPSPKLRHKHSIPLYYPQVRSTSHLSSFGVPIWNCLPPDVVTAPSSDSFKGSLKLLPIL